MPSAQVMIRDPGGTVLATARVSDEGEFFSGPVELGAMPESLRMKFEEYESIVNDQVFGLLDRLEGEIDALRLVVSFDDGRELPLSDLQIFPGAGTISFRLMDSPEVPADRARDRRPARLA